MTNSTHLRHSLLIDTYDSIMLMTQVALPHYRESWFSERAVERYLQFLHLKFLHKTAFIVPPYDMDLLWHIHMVSAVSF